MLFPPVTKKPLTCWWTWCCLNSPSCTVFLAELEWAVVAGCSNLAGSASCSKEKARKIQKKKRIIIGHKYLKLKFLWNMLIWVKRENRCHHYVYMCINGAGARCLALHSILEGRKNMPTSKVLSISFNWTQKRMLKLQSNVSLVFWHPYARHLFDK